jgi:hypothetical protein
LTSDGTIVEGFAAGGTVGGGFDFQLARWCIVGTKLGYNFTDDFTGTFGRITSYNGVELVIDFSFILGGSKKPASWTIVHNGRSI